MIFAIGLMPFYYSLALDMRMIEHAPSLILEAFAPVIVPFLSKEGLSFETTSSLYLFAS